MILTNFPSIITDVGMFELGNLVEEYQMNRDLSLEKLSRLEILLMTYYMQTGNIIHKEMFEEIKIKLQKLSDDGSYVSKNIKFLYESSFIDRNPEWILKERQK